MSGAITPAVFEARKNLEFNCFSTKDVGLLRPLLPSLLRCVLFEHHGGEGTPFSEADRQSLLMLLLEFPLANDVCDSMHVNFSNIEKDCKKKQRLKVKAGGFTVDDRKLSAIDFERSSPYGRIGMIVSDILSIEHELTTTPPGSPVTVSPTNLLSSPAYSDWIGDLLCVAMSELPILLNIRLVTDCFLHTDPHHELLVKVVTNFPEKLYEACGHIIDGSKGAGKDMTERRVSMLQALYHINPPVLQFCITQCIRRMCLPSFLMWALLSSPDCFVTRAGQLLLTAVPESRSWFSQYVKQLPEGSPSLLKVRSLISGELEALTPSSGTVLSNSQCVRAVTLLRLYAALRALLGFRLSDEESSYVCELITSTPPQSQAGVTFLCTGFCFIISCQQLLQNQSEKRILPWLRLLSDRHKSYEIEDASESIGQLLLLVAIHFHGNQTTPVAELAAQGLQIKTSSIKTSSLSLLKIIFTQDVFTEQVVASHAAVVPVTKQLTNKMSGFLPIQCVLQLLKSRTFSKHRVQIKDWIYRQIKECALPLHHAVPALIKAFVTSVVPSQHDRVDKLNSPLSEEEVSLVFCGPEVTTVDVDTSATIFGGQVTMLYYVLAYQEALAAAQAKQSASKRMTKPYSDSLLSNVPVQKLISMARQHQDELSGLFEPLLGLLVSTYYHMCIYDGYRPRETPAPVGSHMLAEARKFLKKKPSSGDVQRKLGECEQYLTVCQELQTVYDDRHRGGTMVNSEMACSCISSVVSTGNSAGTAHSRAHLLAAKALWSACAQIMPKRFLVDTVHSLQSPGHWAHYREKDLCKDPLIILKCADSVYRAPPLMDLMMTLLEKYMEASASYYDGVISTNHRHSENDQRELKFSLNSVTESEAVQTLLDKCVLCLGSSNTRGNLTSQREVQGLICSFIHRAFIRSPHLIKLVSFQGFDTSLIPLVVSGVPSMHVNLDHIPEMLSLPEIDKQMFAVQLVASLCSMYALPKSMVMARLAINVLSTLINLLPRGAIVEYVSPVLLDLKRLRETFPPLNEEWSDFLCQLAAILQ